MKTAINKSGVLRGKRGSYLVESAIVLPVFLIAVLVMSSVILMYACIENSSFIAANEMRRGAAEALYLDTSVLIPYRIKKEISDEHSQVESAHVTDYGYRVSKWGQDELIALSLDMTLRTKNPLGLKARAGYRLSLVTRAYVGKVRDCPSMTEGEMSGDDCDPVYIFPARGERYHSKGCGFLKAASTSGTLNGNIRKHYKPCPLCGSRKASNGSLVYYFPSAGEDYHLPGCSALKRNYIETERRDAVARGYTPCSKCGG
ncbi:MAG: hypothetical protein E7220_00550 [Clostridiales bacterium]|nr:hypothetical protein [Clostridiales bacterium]